MIKRFALAVLCALWCTSWAFADDAGPRRDIRSIRSDLPVLLAASAAGPVISSVVVRGDDAVATWSVGAIEWIGILNRRYRRWWLLKSFFVEPNGIVGCYGGYGTLRVDPALASLAQLHIPVVAAAPARRIASCPKEDASRFDRPTTVTALYGITFAFAINDAAPNDRVTGILQRAPTLGESWLTPESDAYAFFSGIVTAATQVHVKAGTTIRVWFPFVLDPSLRYRMTIGTTRGTPIGPVPGTLAKNTLQFTLPALTLEPGADLMAEIDGDQPN